jgi:hypothetical protein
MFALLWLLTARRDMSLFIRINTYGVFFTAIIIISIASIGIYALCTTNIEYIGYLDNA